MVQLDEVYILPGRTDGKTPTQGDQDQSPSNGEGTLVSAGTELPAKWSAASARRLRITSGTSRNNPDYSRR